MNDALDIVENDQYFERHLRAFIAVAQCMDYQLGFWTVEKYVFSGVTQLLG